MKSLEDIFHKYTIEKKEDSDKYKIMVVDDDFYMRKSIKSIFTNVGFDIISCENKKEAISSLDERIKVVILDIKLPKTNGIEIYKEIKSHYQDLPIIFFSADAGDDTQKCLNLNPYAYIFKGEKNCYEKLFFYVNKAIKTNNNIKNL
jgi:DNA-binding NtrC family response regulator